MKPNIFGSACGEPTEPASEVVGHDAALPAVGPQGGSPGIEVSTEYVMALQDAGQFNMWEPVLRKVLPSREHSLLLGQICFDVTDGDQRGSWLLPEELLAEGIASVGEDHEDRQIFTNTPVSEEEQEAIEQVLLQLLESQKADVEENTASRDPSMILGVQPVWLEQLVLRYLYSCSFDTQKTFDLLQSTLSFRRQQLPVSLCHLLLSRSQKSHTRSWLNRVLRAFFCFCNFWVDYLCYYHIISLLNCSTGA